MQKRRRGKTVLSAMMTKIISGKGEKKILVIDADYACGLSLALGVRVKRTVDDIRNDLIDRVKKCQSGDKTYNG